MTPLTSTPAQPLAFERIFLEKVWGGRALERTPGIALPPDRPIGETWEVVDRSDQQSVVASGAQRGRSLEELVKAAGVALLGKAATNRKGRFPLLVKYIDASEHLSVQVHPDDETAARIGGGAEGKTEAWYILDAEPGAKLWCGLKPEVDADAFGRAARAADPALVDMLVEHEVKGGDCISVPGRTVHAIGAGITLLEVQQNSDTTYRIYDWGRVGLDGEPREVHIEEALACTAFGEAAPEPVSSDRTSDGSSVLVSSPYFEIAEFRVDGTRALADEERFRILVAVRGAGELVTAGAEEPTALRAGDTLLLPAAARGAELRNLGEELTVIQLGATIRSDES